MTNYERICADEAFCALIVMENFADKTFEEAMMWLDAEQTEVESI